MPTDPVTLLAYAIFALVSLFAWSFSVLGLAYIVGHSAISQPIRDWLLDVGEMRTIRRALCVTFVTLIECPVCFSTWVGLIVGVLGATSFGGFYCLIPISLACYSAGTSFALGRFTRLID